MPISIIEFETIDSTNTYGLKHFDELEDKTVITALEQTKGRGRFDRVWVSGRFENIYMSFILKPSKLTRIANLTQYLCAAAAKVIETYGVSTQIKYPNDVLVDGKKICGILCESKLKDNAIQGVVLGIGVNLNTPQEVIDSIDRPATSLNLATGKHIDRYLFLNKLVEEFFSNYEKAIHEGFSAFEEDYLKRTEFLGKKIFIQQRDNSQKDECTALRLDKNGNLIVKTLSGKEKTILSGDLIL